jgi:hypothetical protein
METPTERCQIVCWNARVEYVPHHFQPARQGSTVYEIYSGVLPAVVNTLHTEREDQQNSSREGKYHRGFSPEKTWEIFLYS